MPLTDFLDIFVSRRKLCLTLLGGCVLLSLAWYRLQVQSYHVSVLLSVTRTATETTTEYRYDQLYRLQADERFADTVVRYLVTDQARRDLANRAGLSRDESAYFLRRAPEAIRLSSQLIQTTLPARTLRGGERLAAALPETLNRYTAELNASADDPQWFTLIASEPVIEDARVSWRLALLGGFLGGLFLAFWTALLQHALTRKDVSHEHRH